jgi:hypothetical protein
MNIYLGKSPDVNGIACIIRDVRQEQGGNVQTVKTLYY